MSTTAILTPDVYNRIQNLYSQLLVSANQASSTVNCSIGIGQITGTMNDNCVININNVCRNSNDSQSLLDVATSTILGILNNSTSNSLLQTYNTLRQDCLAQSQLLQNITIQDINLGICKPRFRTEFNITNSGEAVSNCISTGLLRLTQSQSITTESDVYQTLKENYPMIALTIIGGGIIVISLLLFNRKKVSIVWKRT